VSISKVKNNYLIRKLLNIIIFLISTFCTIFTLSLLFFIFGYILYQGITALSWDFFTKLPVPVGETGGGMAHAIVGTIKLLFVAVAISFPVGLMGGIYISEFGGRPSSQGKGRFAYSVRYAADILNGIPSIVIGIFVYIVVVLPMKHFSTLAGGIALGMIMIPIVLKGTEEFLKLVPSTLREAGLALGMPEWKVILTIILPTAFPGVMTSMMLAIARASGETAPLLFTAFGNRHFSAGWMEPTASLPAMIYIYSISPYEDWRQQAWAGGAVLLLLVLLTNILSRTFLRRRKMA
jgi:phosphate transport system permease protein